MSFKKTEVGIIPQDWNVKTVEELVNENIIEKPLDGNHGGTHPKNTDFIDSGIPFIMASDIRGRDVDYKKCKFISEDKAKGLRKGFAKNGDVLLTHKATIGLSAIVRDIKNEFIILTPQITYYRVKDYEKINNIFLLYYFKYEGFKRLFENWAGGGSTRLYLGITNQRKLPIIMPSIEEQKAIANILSSLDDKIEVNNKINKRLEEMAQAIFKQWFIDFEFPNEEGKPYKSSGGEMVESELGMIPKGWEVKELGDISKIIGGGTPSTKIEEYYNGDIPWITPKDLSGYDRKFIKNGSRSITKLGLDKSSAKLLPKGSVLFSSRAPIGYITISENIVTTNQGFKSIDCSEGKISNNYVYYTLINQVEDIKNNATGSTFKEVSGQFMKKIKLIVPNDNILNKFEAIINSNDSELKKNYREIDILTNLKEILLPKLMSGEIRVSLDK